MTRQDRLLLTLGTGRRLCDDCLSDISGVKPRQSVYQACSSLRDQGLLTRMTEKCESCNRMKITNALANQANLSNATASPPKFEQPVALRIAEKPTSTIDRPWYWEGRVQSQIVRFLRASNITVVFEANTVSREPGKDIEAIDADGSVLWVTVKGFPAKSQNTQARHWYAGVLLDLALYRNENGAAKLAIGLPRGFSTYENLVRRTIDTLKFLACDIFWADANGDVTRESAKTYLPK